MSEQSDVRARGMRRTRHLLMAAAAATHNERTRAELDEALRVVHTMENGAYDSQRLDWLAANPGRVLHRGGMPNRPDGWYVRDEDGRGTLAVYTLREAIDAAMAEERKGSATLPA